MLRLGKLMIQERPDGEVYLLESEVLQQHPRNPCLAVDCIIRLNGGHHLVLIKRKNPPFGLALPGGFVDYGESLEAAVRREMMEEVGLRLDLLTQFKSFSDPSRDPRQHTVSVVFSAYSEDIPRAGDDAAELVVIETFKYKEYEYAFDHKKVLEEYFHDN